MDSGVDIVVLGVDISVLVSNALVLSVDISVLGLDIINSGVYVYLGRRHNKRLGGAVESWS